MDCDKKSLYCHHYIIEIEKKQPQGEKREEVCEKMSMKNAIKQDGGLTFWRESVIMNRYIGSGCCAVGDVSERRRWRRKRGKRSGSDLAKASANARR
jgi:hypothetical protein